MHVQSQRATSPITETAQEKKQNTKKQLAKENTY
jgi:hypothetical protein